LKSSLFVKTTDPARDHPPVSTLLIQLGESASEKWDSSTE